MGLLFHLVQIEQFWPVQLQVTKRQLHSRWLILQGSSVSEQQHVCIHKSEPQQIAKLSSNGNTSQN